MSKPRPIKICGNLSWLQIEIVEGDSPYMWVRGHDVSGYIADRDVKRLHEWTKRCLAAMKKKRKGKR